MLLCEGPSEKVLNGGKIDKMTMLFGYNVQDLEGCESSDRVSLVKKTIRGWPLLATRVSFLSVPET